MREYLTPISFYENIRILSMLLSNKIMRKNQDLEFLLHVKKMLSKPITVLILFAFLYFSIPKFDLFFVPGSVTGIRIQDLICLFLFVILFNYKINSKTFLLLLFLMIHLLYSLMVWSSYTSIYGFLRLIEYFFVAKGFQLIIEKGYWKHFYNLIFIYIFFISLGQYLTLLPNFLIQDAA